MTALAASAGFLARLLPAPVDDKALPERVRHEIRLEQRRGDVLVGTVQAVVCAIFALLYLFARKTYPTDAPFNPVPWALAAYAAFTALRLAAARRDRLPGWFQLLSIVVDMTLLLGLIWSFHLQYRQVPAFYLKAPTVLYLFIFIALRALRFEARYVLVAGATAAAGWLALVGYAVAYDPSAMPVTRDYIAYMTSPVILWGAEIDKIVSILLVTALLAVAITRAQRMLLRAVTDGEAARDLKRFFAPDVAARITGADRAVRPGEGEIRDAAAMFIDLRGFTSLARQLDANGLVALLAEYQARIVPVIQRHGGSIDKFLGDGIMASFGAARPSPTYAADALRCVDDIVAVAELWRQARLTQGLPGTEIGIAVASGPVLFGAVGDASRLEYTVIGDPVNLAAKLEKHTKVEHVRALTTADTFDRGVAQGYRTPRRDIRPFARVAGVDHPITLVALAA